MKHRYIVAESLLLASMDRYEGQRAANWSHYSATCIDTSNPALLWTRQAYDNRDEDRQ